MKHKLRARLLPLLLALTLLLAPAARALTVEQARTLLVTYYIDDIPQEVLEQPTIQEILDALGDPYTTYFTPEEYQAFVGSMSDQSLVGIGISSLGVEEGLYLSRVYEGTPAAGAGLQAGDLIVAINGREAAGEDVQTLASWLKGEAGDQVSVTYLRDGERTSVSMTLRELVLPATVTELWDGRVGYIDCDTFGPETLAHFTEGLDAYAGEAGRWIVDLRGNGGGAVDAAFRSLGLFTGEGALGYLLDGTGTYQRYVYDESASAGAPVIVLTSADTASASELFAAGVRDTGAGLVIGERTFGKGVAQDVFTREALPQLFPDGDAMKITAMRFYAPSGTTTDAVGVIPHLLVPGGLAGEVARLLCAPAPEGAPAGTLRIDFGGRWYVDLEQALSGESRAAFAALLEALPATVRAFRGDGTQWAAASPAALAGELGLEEFRRGGFSDSVESRFGAQIDALAAYGVLRGAGDGAFRPFQTLTRAELCALLAQALDCKRSVGGESRFTDVALDDWHGLAVNALADMGLVSGVGGGLFRPDDPVTHEQFITILGRLGKRLNMYLDMDGAQVPAGVSAAEVFAPWSAWSKEYAWLLSMSQQTAQGETLSLLWDELWDIDPAAPTTREEAAALTYNLLSYIGVLPV